MKILYSGFILATEYHRSFDRLAAKSVGHFPNTTGHRFDQRLSRREMIKKVQTDPMKGGKDHFLLLNNLNFILF